MIGNCRFTRLVVFVQNVHFALVFSIHLLPAPFCIEFSQSSVRVIFARLEASTSWQVSQIRLFDFLQGTYKSGGGLNIVAGIADSSLPILKLILMLSLKAPKRDRHRRFAS